MEQFIKMLESGKSQFHVAHSAMNILEQQGFSLLSLHDDWDLKAGGKYMVMPYSSMLIAWNMGKSATALRIAAAHTDFPMLKIKPNPYICKKGYVQLNVEPYGGLIKNAWFDRPLGIAGKVVTRGADVFSPEIKLFDSKKPICVIPNLAPHLKRDNKPQDLDVQKELIPILCTFDALSTIIAPEHLTESFLLDYLADNLNISSEDILDYDLYLYIDETPKYLGFKDEFLASARIDNISSVSAIIDALSSDNIDNCIGVGAFFDNEEIGSRSKQGADSMLLRDILSKILPDKALLKHAFNMSVDVAHATHPNYIEKNDITNDIILGNGVVLKSSASQKYVTDSEAGAVAYALAGENNIKIQRLVNRSGIPGGQTLGPIMSAYLPIKSVDIGIPMLAMHSSCELIHRNDYTELVRLLKAYYEY